MRRVETERLDLGMVLAEAVRGPRGDVLLGAGVELTERHLRGLRTWGITAVLIAGDDATADPESAARELTAGELDAARAAVAGRFARAGMDHPVLACLAEEAARRHALALAAAPST